MVADAAPVAIVVAAAVIHARGALHAVGAAPHPGVTQALGAGVAEWASFSSVQTSWKEGCWKFVAAREVL